MSEPPFEVLLGALRAELAALDGEDAQAIEAATAAKLAALHGLRDAPVPARAALLTAQALNLEAQARTRTRMASVDRRLRDLATSAGRSPALTYGRDGRSAL